MVSIYSSFLCLGLATTNLWKGKKSYPPQSNGDLRKLHKSITQTDAPEHVKQSLILYLLKDLDNLPGSNAASQFAENCFLPNKLLTFIEGIHSLDRLHFEVCLKSRN